MIVCVHSDMATRERTRNRLASAGFDTVSYATIDETLAAIADHSAIEVLVTAYELSDGTGLELIRAIRDRAPDTACILFTELPVEEIETDAVGETVAEFLRQDQPDAMDELVRLVESSLAFRSQTSYPLPDDEDARLAALERYTDQTAALDSSLTRLTDIAKALFEVDSAAIGLIDAHSEQFLSCSGASFQTMDREETICTYTILEDQVTVIEDVAADPRFDTNEGLAAAGIRFYAGAPLVTDDGHAIGVFCVHDSAPQSFSEQDRTLLISLAGEAMEQLELRRQLREARGTGRDE